MSEKKDDGGPAFPVISDDWRNGIEVETGQSLRDWFAATIQLRPDQWEYIRQSGLTGGQQDDIEASMRYAKADAMLEARKR